MKLTAEQALDLPFAELADLYIEEKTARKKTNTVYGYHGVVVREL